VPGIIYALQSWPVRRKILDSTVRMAQLDFRQAFSPPPGEASPVFESGVMPSSDSEEITTLETKRILATHVPRLHQSYRTMFLFAVFTFVGGLFCAFYFFNGDEILRAATAWSREFLYPRPSALVAKSDKADTLKPESAANLSPAMPSWDSRKAGPDRDANASPFGRNASSPNSPFSPGSTAGGPNAPAGTLLPGSGSVPSPSSLLGQLNLLPAGEDALSQTMNQAAAQIARVANLYANSPVHVIHVPVSQAAKKAAARARAKRAAQNAIANAAAQQKLKNSARQTSQPVSSTRSGTSGLSQFEPPTVITSGSDLSNGSGTGGSLGGSSALGRGGMGTTGGMGGLGGTVGGRLGGH
jgi:hypothetical protein